MTPLLISIACAALLAVSVLAVIYPQIALVLLVALDVSHLNGVIQDNLGVSPYLPQLFLAAVALGVMVRRRMFRFSWSPVLLGLAVLFAGFCLSFLSVADPDTSYALLLERGRDLVNFLIVYALLLSTDRIRSALQAAVLVLAGLSALSVFHEFMLDNSGTLWGLSQVPLTQEGGAFTPRHAGTHEDVNFWARLLIMFTPLCLSLFAMSRAAIPKVLWASSAVALMLGVYLTQSRGGFIALFLGLLVWAALAGGVYRKSLLWLPLGLLILIPLTGIGSRLATLAATWNGDTTNADISVVTRERLQLAALRMFLDAPATGHGIGSYGTLFPSYDRLANYHESVPIGVAAHNFFLEQAADGGVVLLLAWMVFLGTVLFGALRAMATTRRTSDQQTYYLATGIVGGIFGWLIASVFLHLSDFRALLLMAAVVGALDVRTRRTPLVVSAAPTLPFRDRSRGALHALVAVATAGTVALIAVVATAEERFSSSTTLAVVSTSTEISPADAYRLDVINRGLIVPTLATMLDKSISVQDLQAERGEQYSPTEISVDVRQSRLGGAVIVYVTAADEQMASELGGAVSRMAQDEVAALESGYQLTGAPSNAIPKAAPQIWAALPLGLIVLVSSLSALLIAHRRRVRASAII
nr:O-antigen ligase family protein [Kocuria rosea]